MRYQLIDVYKFTFGILLIGLISTWAIVQDEKDLMERVRWCVADYDPDATDPDNAEGFSQYVMECSKCLAKTRSEGDGRPCDRKLKGGKYVESQKEVEGKKIHRGPRS